MHKKVAVLAGDGIGPEVTKEAVEVLKLQADKYNIEVLLKEGLIGGAAYDACGVPLPEETIRLCEESDCILLGAVGGPKWDNLPVELRPEAGALLPLRKRLELYANLRPVVVFPSLKKSSPLKEEIIESVDFMVVRELTGGLYFGPKGREVKDGKEAAWDTMYYTRDEIERIVRFAFECAKGRRGNLTSVDKHNVLETSRFWREIVEEIHRDYPEVNLNHLYVDNASMQIIRNPRQFDVIVTENTFGDIITDEASVLTGSIGLLPSASIGNNNALYEPIHGSAPDIAGQGKANPLAAILSVALLFEYSFNLSRAAKEIWQAVGDVLAEGFGTPDMIKEKEKIVSTKQMGEMVQDKLRRI